MKVGDQVQHRVSGETYTIKSIHLLPGTNKISKLHFEQIPGWFRAEHYNLVEKEQFKLGDRYFWDWEDECDKEVFTDTYETLWFTITNCSPKTIEVTFDDGSGYNWFKDSKRVQNYIIKEEDMKYEAKFEVFKNNKLTTLARCGHAHNDRRSAGQCARHYGNKIKESGKIGKKETFNSESMELTPRRAQKIQTAEQKFGVKYTPGGLPVPVEDTLKLGDKLVVTDTLREAGGLWEPGTIVEFLDFAGKDSYSIKTPNGETGNWLKNRFKPHNGPMPGDKLEFVKDVLGVEGRNYKVGDVVTFLRISSSGGYYVKCSDGYKGGWLSKMFKPHIPTEEPKMATSKLELLEKLLTPDIDEDKIRAIVRDEAGNINKYIPKLVTIKTPKKTIEPKEGEIQHPEYERLARWINGHVTRVWIFGPAGTGKTHACIQISKALELPFYLQPRVADEYQLSGFKDAHGNYHATQIYRWAHDENPRSVLILDEVDRNLDVVNIWYNAALANGYIVFPDGPVEIEPSKLVIATANTVGHGNNIRYSAAQSQDVALLDRFSLKLPWNIDEDTELQIALSRYPYDKTEKTVEASVRVRNAITDNGISLEWGPRRTYAACEAVSSGEKLKAAFEYAGLNEIEDKNTKKKVLNVV